jgi:hypothetical protein
MCTFSEPPFFSDPEPPLLGGHGTHEGLPLFSEPPFCSEELWVVVVVVRVYVVTLRPCT